jgi:hypothetical protein
MQAEELADTEQLERVLMEDRAVRGVLRNRRRVGLVNLHPQSTRATRDRLPDSSHPKDPEHLPRQLPAHERERRAVWLFT